MNTRLLVIGALLASTLPAQRIVKKDSPKDMSAILERAGSSFGQSQFATTVAELKKALALAANRLEAAILAAMPKPPAGFKVKDGAAHQRSRGAMGLLPVTQIPVEWSCHKDGKHSLTIQVHGNDSMAGIIKMTMGLAHTDPSVDVVEYEGVQAVLRKHKSGERLELHALLGGYVLVANARGMDQEQFFALVNEALMQRLRKTFGLN